MVKRFIRTYTPFICTIMALVNGVLFMKGVKAYHYDSINLYVTRTPASDEVMAILKENTLMYLLSLLKAKLEIYYYNEVRIQYSFLIFFALSCE